MRKLYSRVSFFVLTALLIGGFPNFMVQEAHAFTIFTAVIDDQDNANQAIDAADVIFINFGIATNATAGGTMSNAELTANFTSPLFGAGTATGTWVDTTGANSNQILRITLGAGAAGAVGNTVTYQLAATDGGIFNLAENDEVDATAIVTTGNFGLIPDVISAVWDDPDNGDSIFGAGDTLTLTFDTATNQAAYANRAAVDAVMTITGLSAVGAATYSAAWTSTTVLVVTIIDPDTATPTVGSNVDGVTTAAGVISSESGSVGEWDNTLATTGDFGDSSGASSGGGSGCDDCEAPTLGVDKRGTRLVSDGFTYNGNSVDAERFFTPYPLITANVGKTNIAQFKIYENEGVSNIRHFTLAFGMDKGDIISDSKAKIELDIDHEGTETVTVTDPENVLDEIKVTTSTVSCMDDSFTECLGISIQHRFRAPLDFNIVGTDVWDSKRNAWQNTFNHGIEVVGESLNPAKEYDGINKGQIYHLIETSKTTAVDEFGNSWTFNYGLWNMDYIDNKNTPVILFLKEIIPTDDGFAGSDQFGTMYYLTQTSEITAVDMFGNNWSLESGQWTMDSIYSKMILDSTPMGGYTRSDSEFSVYKYGQSLLAENKLTEICSDCFDETFGEIDDIFAYDFQTIE